MKWFTPFSVVDSPALGTTLAHEFSGRALDARWSAPNRKSAFFGAFSFEARRANVQLSSTITKVTKLDTKGTKILD